MEKEVLVEVKNVSKKFCTDLKTSLRYGLQDSLQAILPFNKAVEKTLRKKEFWAVKDISFTLKRGECIGLIGHNGAGKSTLLKMINGLINPDAGSIKLKGKIGALIELGAGFNPILTGRENIYNNAAVLGFSKKEIDAKMDAIIEFSEIEEFLDMPLQNDSSGMKVRLGFAVAAHLEPDILIVDEVLAVGDLGFVLKCFQTIDKILPKTAMIFVSHSMPMVSRICSEIILMEKGQVKYQGTDVSKGIDLYYNKFANNKENIVLGSNKVSLKEVTLNGVNLKENSPSLKWNSEFELTLKFNNNELSHCPFLSVTIFDKEQRPVALFNNKMELLPIPKGEFIIKLNHENLQLSKGIYSVNVSLSLKQKTSPLLRINGVGFFQMISNHEVWPPFLLDSKVELEIN